MAAIRQDYLWVIIALVFILGVMVGYGLTKNKGGKWSLPEGQTPEEPQGVVCTMEAKLCPDGSYVGRTGPNCEFSPCPGE